MELELGNPLQLTKTMRRRLLAAVQALLADPALEGLSDAARLATVVLFAKSRYPEGRWDDNVTSTWGAELGRWMGMTDSTVHHDVLPKLRKQDALHTQAVTDEQGHPTGLDCLVMPLWHARHAGGPEHPLALKRQELAVLLRLCEVLFGPGWAPKDREETLPGLLASRAGKGAATDRLGLLLLVLSTSPKGWLRLCPGTVDGNRGRPAATVARLLGRSASGGAKLLARLEDQGVAEVVRRKTAQGAHGKSRVRLLPIAEAYREHEQALREARKAAGPVFLHLPPPAGGDLDPAGPTDAQAMGADMSDNPDSADLPDTAQLHTTHSPVAKDSGCGAGSSGFSGEADRGSGDRPKRVRVREDGSKEPRESAGDGAAAADAVAGGPLRGEKPKTHLINTAVQEAVSGITGVIERDGGLRRVPLPPDDLRQVLGPVMALWTRLERGSTRGKVAKATRKHISIAAAVVGLEAASSLVEQRLMRRLCDQPGGPDAVTSPVGWFLARGLPHRSDCGDHRCEEGVRMDSGGPCKSCEMLLDDRRADRNAAAAAVRQQTPALIGPAWRQRYEQELREQAAQKTARQVERAEEARLEEAQSLDDLRARRAEAAAAATVRQAQPCVKCGAQDAAGLCGSCMAGQEAQALTENAALVAAAAWAAPGDRREIEAALARARARIQAAVEEACAQDRARGVTEEVMLGLTARLAVQSAAEAMRRQALSHLAGSAEARREEAQVHAAALRSAYRYPSWEEANQAADTEASAARWRAAEALLEARTLSLQAVLGQESVASTVTCAGVAGERCDREALPTRDVCFRHRAAELEVA